MFDAVLVDCWGVEAGSRTQRNYHYRLKARKLAVSQHRSKRRSLTAREERRAVAHKEITIID